MIVEDEPRINTNRHQYRWASIAATTSRNGARPGARASRPHTSLYNFGHLLDPARPATAPGLCFGRALAVPAVRVAGRHISGKLSGTLRHSMRAGRPRSRVGCLLPSLLLLEGARAGLPGRSPDGAAEPYI